MSVYLYLERNPSSASTKDLFAMNEKDAVKVTKNKSELLWK